VDDATVTLARDALRAGPVAQVVLDGDGAVVVASHRATELLGSDACELGRPFADDGLRALAVRAAVTGIGEEVPYPTGRHRVTVTPLCTGAALTFTDAETVEELGHARQQLRRTVAELASLSEQLHRSNSHLRAVSEDLGSANAELETLNEELRDRSLELAELDETLHEVVRASGCAAVVVDARGRVAVWTHAAAELWSLPAVLAEGRSLGALQAAAELVDDFRARLALNVSYDLACEALAFRLERTLARG
jgi:two-component system CheB/CheR fusion protein